MDFNKVLEYRKKYPIFSGTKDALYDAIIDGSYKFDIVELTGSTYLYGGYYSDYGKKGNYDISNPQAGTFGESYLGDRTSWNINNAYKTSGKSIVPVPGKTYFLKEVYRGYLYGGCFRTTDRYDENRLRQIIFVTGIDDSNYRVVGFDGLASSDNRGDKNPYLKIFDHLTLNTNKFYYLKDFFSFLSDREGYLSFFAYIIRNDSIRRNYSYCKWCY